MVNFSNATVITRATILMAESSNSIDQNLTYIEYVCEQLYYFLDDYCMYLLK